MSQSLVCDGMSTHIIHTLYFWMARIMINPGLRWQQCDGIHQSRDMNVITILFFHLDFSLNWNFMQKRNVISWWTNQRIMICLFRALFLSIFFFLSRSLLLCVCHSLSHSPWPTWHLCHCCCCHLWDDASRISHALDISTELNRFKIRSTLVD